METIASTITATILFIVLYILVILTITRLLISSDYKLPEKLNWITKLLDGPVLEPVIYWLYFFSTGKRKEKDNTPS